MSKRQVENDGALISKRAKSSEIEQKLGLNVDTSQQLTLSKKKDDDNQQLIISIQRTSKLNAPIIKLEGCHSVCCSYNYNYIYFSFNDMFQ